MRRSYSYSYYYSEDEFRRSLCTLYREVQHFPLRRFHMPECAGWLHVAFFSPQQRSGSDQQPPPLSFFQRLKHRLTGRPSVRKMWGHVIAGVITLSSQPHAKAQPLTSFSASASASASASSSASASGSGSGLLQIHLAGCCECGHCPRGEASVVSYHDSEEDDHDSEEDTRPRTRTHTRTHTRRTHERDAEQEQCHVHAYALSPATLQSHSSHASHPPLAQQSRTQSQLGGSSPSSSSSPASASAFASHHSERGNAASTVLSQQPPSVLSQQPSVLSQQPPYLSAGGERGGSWVRDAARTAANAPSSWGTHLLSCVDVSRACVVALFVRAGHADSVADYSEGAQWLDALHWNLHFHHFARFRPHLLPPEAFRKDRTAFPLSAGSRRPRGLAPLAMAMAGAGAVAPNSFPL